jgi:hypothetical protein
VKSNVITILLVFAGCFGVVSWVDRNQGGGGDHVGPIVASGLVKERVQVFCADASTAYKAFSSQLRAGKIKSSLDAKAYWIGEKGASKKIDEHAFKPLDDKLKEATGDKWDAEKIATQSDEFKAEYGALAEALK